MDRNAEDIPGLFNRRSHLRYKKSYRIFWNHKEVRCAGVTLDICPGGIFVVTCMPLPEESELDVEIWIGDELTPLRCRGRVAWVNRGEVVTYPPGFGLRFLETDQARADWLSRLCLDDEDPHSNLPIV